MTGRRTFGGTAGGSRSGRNGVEYTRVVPRFLQGMMAVNDDVQLQRGVSMPNSRRRAEGKQNTAADPNQSADTVRDTEIAALRKDGFRVDVGETHGGDLPSGSPVPVRIGDAKIAAAEKRSGGKEQRSLKVGVRVIDKSVISRKTKDAFSTRNKSKLSFSVHSDSGSHETDNEGS